MADVLVVDDDPMVAGAFARYLTTAGHSVRQAPTGAAALAAWHARRPDVTLLDVRLPDMSGFDVYARIRDSRPVVIMISGDADIPLAVRAVQEGVETFLAKPVVPAQLGVALERAVEVVRQRQLARFVTGRRAASGNLVLGRSPAMRELSEQLAVLAATDRATVLLQGEHGTGKGRVAAWLHAHSPRAHAPFLAVHCAGRDPRELEAELFGSDDPVLGAPDVGAVEVAAGGTVLLDAIGELAPALQAKLWRLLEARCFRRVGSARENPADVRIIATSSSDLASAVTAGRLREELYYRLCERPVTLPPLRSRSREDVTDLVTGLVDELATQLPSPPRVVDDVAMDALLRYAWPGNIRELRAVLERALIVGRGSHALEPRFLPPEVAGARDESAHTTRSGEPDLRTLDAVERAHIEQTLRRHDGNRTHASRALGISRATLIKKIKTFGALAGNE